MPDIASRDTIEGDVIEIIYPEDSPHTYSDLILVHAIALDAFLKQTLGYGAFGHCTSSMSKVFLQQNINEWNIICLYAYHAETLAALLSYEFADYSPLDDSIANIRVMLIAFAEYVQVFRKNLAKDVKIPAHVNPEGWLEAIK